MNQIVVYTCITTGFNNTLHHPQQQADGVQYVAILDRPELYGKVHEGWLVMPLQSDFAITKRRQARWHKLHPEILFPGIRYTLWVDGCLTPITHMREMVDHYLQQHDICVFRHEERNCIYQEAEACIRLKKDSPHIVRAQMARYRKEGYPHHNRLAETTAVLRRHTGAISLFDAAWWRELEQGSLRDQLSFDYIIWKNKMQYATFAGSRTASPHFQHRAHR